MIVVREVWLIKSEDKNKAELAIKKPACPKCGSNQVYFDEEKGNYVCKECGFFGSPDDSTSRASIYIKTPSSLGLDADGVFFIIQCSDEIMKNVEKRLKKYGEKYTAKEAVLKKVDEQDSSAIQGLGSIF